jgi:putative transposase
MRLRGYNYSDNGAYFLTMCAYERRFLFGGVVQGEVQLSEAGRMVKEQWHDLPNRFDGVELDEFVVMPNHVHGILGLCGRSEAGLRPTSLVLTASGEDKLRAYGTLPETVGRVVQAFKSLTTNAYIHGVRQLGWPAFNRHVWQANYYDHVVRNEHALGLIREYIFTNPQRWSDDLENPQATGTDDVGAFIRAMESVDIDAGEHKVRPYGGGA